MKTGRYFSIPEGPADLLVVWNQAVRLNPSHLPPWLTADDAASYRQVRPNSQEVVTAADQSQRDAELDELAEIGFVLDDGPAGSHLPEVYVEAPRTEEIWSIGLSGGPSPWELSPHQSAHQPILTREDVTDVPASFVADPFMVQHGDRYHLFFEVLNWKSRKGEIGWAESRDGIAWTYQKIVLAEPFHLSFPQVFAWNGKFYMTPESYQAGEVRLYEAVRFPDEWRYVGPLFSGPYYVDPVLFRHANCWWALVDGSRDEANDTLLLMMAEELTGPWRPHPQSPLVAGDPHHARPAGRVVSWNGGLLRFAQNCVPNYGTDVRCFEITELSPTSYRERPVGSGLVLGPTGAGWNADGMHHVDPHPQPDGSWLAYVDGWRRFDPVNQTGA